VVLEDDRAADVRDLLPFGQREDELAQRLGVLDVEYLGLALYGPRAAVDSLSGALALYR